MLATTNEKSAVNKALSEMAWNFARRMPEADRVRLYLMLLSPEAKSALIDNLYWDARYGDDIKPSAEVNAEKIQLQFRKSKFFVRGLIVGVLLAMSATYLATGAYQQFIKPVASQEVRQ